MKAVLKEKAAAIPKEAVRRGLDDGMERLRTQLRDTVQAGQQDEYGGDRIEDVAAGGLHRMEHGAERLLKKKRPGRPEAPDPAETAQRAPGGGTGRPPIKTREATQMGPSGPTEGGEAAPRAGLGPSPGRAAKPTPVGVTAPQDETSGPTIKTKDTYIQRQTTTTEPPLSQAQGGQEFVRERGRDAARTEALLRSGTASGRDSPSNSRAGTLSKAGRDTEVLSRRSRYGPHSGMPRENDTPHALSMSRRPGIKTGRPGGSLPGRPGRQMAKTADHTAVRTAGTADQAAKRAAEAGRQLTRARKTAQATQRTAKKAVQAAGRALRAMVAAAKSLLSAVMAGSWVVVVLVLIICLIGMLAASPFGVFFSGEDSGSGYTMPKAVVLLNGEFTNRIEQIKADNAYDELDLDNAGSAAMVSNWDDVLAVYAVRTSTDETAPVEVVTVTEEKLSILREIFWDMNAVSYWLETIPGGEDESDTTVLHITVTVKDYSQMADGYGFTAEQRELLEELMGPEYAELFLRLTGSYQDLTLSPAEVREIMEKLPADLSEERKQVVLTAYQLLGKVNYFWGGKSLVLGWDSRWGTPMEVTAAGSSTTGAMRPFGLDCSGYVDWVFYNMTGGEYVIGHGGGASAQHSACTDISWGEAIPGDLVFYPGDSHVGIVCGLDGTGNILIIHCASGQNNVVVTSKGIFSSVARPDCYKEAIP